MMGSRMQAGLEEATATRSALHRESVTAPLHEVASSLEAVLGQPMAAYIAGVKEGKTVHRWATGEIAVVRNIATEQRLRMAYEITQLLLREEGPSTVRAWFMGMNPYLEDRSPAETLHTGQLKEAMDAALVFMADG